MYEVLEVLDWLGVVVVVVVVLLIAMVIHMTSHWNERG